MKLRNIITAIAITAMPLAASAASFVIPVVGNVPGANGSVWRSDVTLHNSSRATLALTLTLRDGSGRSENVTLAPRTTKTFRDIVNSVFTRTGTAGALEIQVDDAYARQLAITSRTYNLTQSGEYGQDIPVTRLDAAAATGEIGVIPGPATAAAARFNFGVFAPTDATVKWELVRKDGTVAATSTETYTANTQLQYSSGAQTLFGSTAEDNDTVYATVAAGRAIFFGSIVDQTTGDPTFVPVALSRDMVHIDFLGVDIDENGTVDIADADDDGVLDAPLELTTSLFPNFFKLVAKGEFGENVTFQLVSAPLDSAIVTPDGTVQAGGPGDLKGKNDQILVRATAGGVSAVLSIPVHYR